MYRIAGERVAGATMPCDRWNLRELALADVCAHGGEGRIRFARVGDREELAGGCNFIDYAELPPGTSIGRHRHADDEEELYLVLEGEGEMWRDGERFAVREGHLVRNAPGGEHGLHNPGPAVLRLFVFELRVAPRVAP
jgi:mannose-6-phosphate isomerase-like protein (cupin superfamily)